MILALLLAAAPAQTGCEYQVTASAGAQTLTIEARIPKGFGDSLSLDPAVLGYVELLPDGGAAGATIPCPASGCTVRYRFRLGDAARELQSRAWAFADGAGLYAAPSSWLLRPNAPPPDARLRLEVKTPKEISFVSGLRRAAEPSTWEGPVSALEDAPWSGFAPFTVSVENVGGASFETAIAPGTLSVSGSQISAWVARTAKLVTTFYGRFPVSRVAILVLPSDGDGVGFGTAMGNGGAAVLVWLGANAGPDALAHDWVLPHELTHFAFPMLPKENTWLEEGLATWVEPLVRTRVGELEVDDYWRTLTAKLPLGLPAKGDRGLDATPTWGRTYWGGALFCFVAELKIREATKNQQGLDTALQAIVAAGGNQEVKWDLKRALEVGDAALGHPVLTSLHAQLGAAPGNVDLPALFKRLGVSVVKGKVLYDDRAPLAATRKAMTARIP